jgi:hypothetical protein
VSRRKASRREKRLLSSSFKRVDADLGGEGVEGSEAFLRCRTSGVDIVACQLVLLEGRGGLRVESEVEGGQVVAILLIVMLFSLAGLGRGSSLALWRCCRSRL